MHPTERRWVPFDTAAREAGVSVTTIRDWCKSGDLDSDVTEEGRVVDLQQAREKAMGFVATITSGLHARLHDPADARPADAPGDATLGLLQALARERLDA